MTIKVTEVDEAPEITVGGLAVSGTTRVDYDEDRRDAVATYTASGPGSANARWSLEGDDAADFRISSSGELTFVRAPDYENPADADMDNTYMVTVVADDGTYMNTRDVTVTVTDVDDVTTGDTLLDTVRRRQRWVDTTRKKHALPWVTTSVRRRARNSALLMREK